MTETSADWNTALQMEQYRATQVMSTMQAISGVPVFDGRSVDLEFFIRRMELIVLQVSKLSFDETTNGYILGYFYSRISVEVLGELGASCDTSWDRLKVLLREKYGGACKTVPRLILREVLMERESVQSTADFAKSVLAGVRKVTARIRDSGKSPEEVRVRCEMLEELATECVQTNLTRRAKQWVRLNKPADLESLVRTVVEEEQEDREERRKNVRGDPVGEREERAGFRSRARQWPEWQTVQRDRRRNGPERLPLKSRGELQPIPRRTEFRKREGFFRGSGSAGNAERRAISRENVPTYTEGRDVNCTATNRWT